MFHQMIASIQEEVATYVMRAQIESNQERQAVVDESQISTSGEPTEKRPVKVSDQIGRNDPCPCGSGKKFKHCHGQE
ncbi:preprotein translocase subunit SecA [compost metagenome]